MTSSIYHCLVGSLLVVTFGGVCSNPVSHRHALKPSIDCVYRNVSYPASKNFRPDGCTYCHCSKVGGRAQCTVQDCIVSVQNCIRYETDGCCKRCVESGCLHSDGKSYPPGALIQTPCSICRCPLKGGRTVCEVVRCPHVSCVNPVREKASCCPRCPGGNNCMMGQRVIRAGVKVYRPNCMHCFCPENTSSLHALLSTKPQAICTRRMDCDEY